MRQSPLFRFGLGLVMVFILVTTGYVLTAAAPQGSGRINCLNGLAGTFPCASVDMLAHLPLDAIGAEDISVKGNDHWGWTDPQTGHEYVLFGLTNGTAFIDITDPENPIYLGKLASHDGASVYRDIKVYQNIAYIVADNIPGHGLQMFDLTQLRTVTTPPVTFSETAHYNGVDSVHTIWINEETGYLYAILRNAGSVCNVGIQILNLQNPISPTLAGCVDESEAPISTAECLIYTGPDQDYQDHELCFLASDDNVSIADVSDKSNPAIISRFTYPGIMRAHQGSMTADLTYWLMADMHDEMHHGHNTRTYIFDITDLDNPVVLGHYQLSTSAMDHSLFIVDNQVYEANLRAGLQIFDISQLPSLNFVPVGYFDVDPSSNSTTMNGAWTVYPFWNDNIVTISDTELGLFITQHTFNPTDVSQTSFGGVAGQNLAAWLLPALIFMLGGLFLVYRRQQVNILSKDNY